MLASALSSLAGPPSGALPTFISCNSQEPSMSRPSTAISFRGSRDLEMDIHRLADVLSVSLYPPVSMFIHT